MAAKDELKRQWDENPTLVIAAGAAAATAVSQLLNAFTNAAGRRTWAKEVKRRQKKTEKE